MFREKTVLVLGAGASHPYGYPTGQTLIHELLHNSESADLSETRKQAGFQHGLFAAFKDALGKASFPSIDEFLEHRAKDFGSIGKFLLAQRLLKKEDPALFFNDATHRWHDDHWYPMLLNAIAPSLAAITQNQLTIVNYNYDRSIKAYLFTAIKARFNPSDADLAKLLEAIPFIHVHGNLGPLPWQTGGTSDSAYGAGITLDKVQRAAANIKIIHEANKTTPEFVAAQKAIKDAGHVFFLGFGYHKANMERLGMPMSPPCPAAPTGTGFKITNAQRNYLKQFYDSLTFGADHHKIKDFMTNSESYLLASGGG